MATEKEKTDKRNQTRSKNEKESQDRESMRRSSHSQNDQASTRSEKRAHEERGSDEKSNRSSSKAKMPKLEAGKSNRTTDHAVIRQWVEDRGGSPATVKATEGKKDPGLLRINFPGYSGKYSLEDISWDDFFKKFDEKNLEFLYQDQTRTGKTSRFFKFVNPSGGEHSRGRSKSQDKEGSSGKENARSSTRSKEKEK